MRKDPNTKKLNGQELLDIIDNKVQEYAITPQKNIVEDKYLKHITRRIFVFDGGRMAMIEQYLKEIRRNLIKTVEQYSNTSMKSITS